MVEHLIASDAEVMSWVRNGVATQLVFQKITHEQKGEILNETEIIMQDMSPKVARMVCSLSIQQHTYGAKIKGILQLIAEAKEMVSKEGNKYGVSP